MTAVGFITFISVLSRLLGLLKKCIIIIYILCIDCAENNKILFDLKSCLTLECFKYAQIIIVAKGVPGH